MRPMVPQAQRGSERAAENPGGVWYISECERLDHGAGLLWKGAGVVGLVLV